MEPKYIRNFSIIAHIDHGKSTLADRMLEITGTVKKRDMQAQLLDDMELERGITIKARSVTIHHEYEGNTYELNLIDTPGHVDFNYEVEKSMQACEGAVLLVDAAQGVEAQTVANAYLALEADLHIMPVLNKVDLAHSRPDEVAEEIETSFAIEATDALHVSAKTGKGVKEVLDQIVREVPPPTGDADAPLRALVFDAVYDDYRGVIVYVRIVDGQLSKKDKVRFMSATTKIHFDALEIGRFMPKLVPCDTLGVGEVGYFISNIKTLGDVRVGDTMTLANTSEGDPLPGYKEPQHMVFADFYPTSPGDYEHMRDALESLSLTDSSLTFDAVTSDALGFGYRCGFLGLLHMEIIEQRLEREFDMDMIQTAPSVTYQLLNHDGTESWVHSPGALPNPDKFEELREPIARVSMLMPTEYIGPVMQISTDHRGIFIRQEHLSQSRVQLVYDIPLAEIMYDFYDKLKSATRGFGTLNYEVTGYKADKLVKLSIMVNGDDVDALSSIVHHTRADMRGRAVIKKLRKEIPRHMFEVRLQAAIGSKILARENIAALRKDVTAKCYGGDISRKRKLLEKQKAGKRRMRQVGNVEIPQKAFLAVLGGDDK
ncbi:MAG: translation elongation factor 4 [Planctomycetota bacterium]|nr:translation elongation factor 4 [Planctomycetota bacterium]